MREVQDWAASRAVTCVSQGSIYREFTPTVHMEVTSMVWDWFQREGFIGQISDIRVQNLQVERENVQKRTFTRWINLHLEKCNPPLEVNDLFVDIQDGKILMALLEVLSGHELLHEYKSSSHRIFRLNNIAKALKFLEDSNVKLVSIDAAEIADGNPSLVLGLIWNIILFFQIKELTGSLSRNSPSSSLSPGSGGTDSDSSFPPTPTTERSEALTLKDQRKAIKTLLAWVQRKTRKYGVAVQDFAGSWRSGLAFLAVIKAVDPSLVDMKQALEDSARENLEKAFSVAHDALHIPRLLEPEDIMVDVPDEQSIVTYVAQFLERFPELEAEDWMDSDKEFPIESTFVHIRDTPSEQESKILLLAENGERTYTVNHETSQPPPAKVFVCDSPETLKECLQPPRPGSLPSSTSPELMHEIIDHGLQGVPSKGSEPSPEVSILSCRKENRRANSLPIKKTVHFEVDFFKDASCSKDPFYSQRLSLDGIPQGTEESVKQKRCSSALAVNEEEKAKQEVSEPPAAAPDEPPVGVPLVSDSSSSSLLASNGPLETPVHPVGECPSDNTIMANSFEVKVPLLSVDFVDKEDSLEAIPLKASKFNSDLEDFTDFASTSQAFREPPSSHQDKVVQQDRAEGHAEELGKRSAKSAHKKDDADRTPRDPGEDAQGSSLTPEEVPLKPEVYEKAKQKSVRQDSNDSQGAEEFGEDDEELPSNPPSSSVSLETLRSHRKEGLNFRPSPPLSKVSVIPHDLFYYPHYEVPLAAVLEAYTEGSEDLKTEDPDLDGPSGYLQDLDTGDDQTDGSQSSCSFSVTDMDLPGTSDRMSCPDSQAVDAQPGPEPAPSALHEDDQQGGTTEDNQSQGPLLSEKLEKPVEEKVAPESTSSKKKEKKKHVDHVESSVFIVPGTVRSSDDLEDDTADFRIPSRTSHSDSSIYIRRHSNRCLESDHFSYVQLRNAADMDDRRNRMLTRYNTQKLTELILQFYGIRADMKRECKRNRMTMKANNSGEASGLGSQSLPNNDSLTQLVQQPDTVYFILFLWLLVYCLLLFPQLDFNRL
ncbi:PREDICTED: calmin [Elephantulus edwardii]|uniref:calmin n=1 Tax=Elephantulus edwardii TaxID=28737 RepID=UPI0003F09AEF|nr:PREDICTED: calmin [Elephantulus edwardii]